ncbi:helicase SRCAP-like [Triticum dicoccoides]|uniref:helicase SRCAP-like n=1 Tax=Triticum dicoccoides TaxID=85692 RepID=UPI00188EA19D|nr:helicase SRCAP-like [Triticum dicoccoides]
MAPRPPVHPHRSTTVPRSHDPASIFSASTEQPSPASRNGCSASSSRASFLEQELDLLPATSCPISLTSFVLRATVDRGATTGARRCRESPSFAGDRVLVLDPATSSSPPVHHSAPQPRSCLDLLCLDGAAVAGLQERLLCIVLARLLPRAGARPAAGDLVPDLPHLLHPASSSRPWRHHRSSPLPGIAVFRRRSRPCPGSALPPPACVSCAGTSKTPAPWPSLPLPERLQDLVCPAASPNPATRILERRRFLPPVARSPVSRTRRRAPRPRVDPVLDRASVASLLDRVAKPSSHCSSASSSPIRPQRPMFPVMLRL